MEASWGRLGSPKREPREAKIEAGRVFFKLKRQEYTKLFLNAFLLVLIRFGSPLGEQKRAFRIGEVAKIKFSGSCVLTSSCDLFWRDFGGQVGAKLEPSWAI